MPTPEGDLVYIPDHVQQAVANLLQQFQDKQRIVALTEALALGAQTQEDEAFGLLISTTLGASSGASLDQWGALVGEARGSLVDSEYRVMISARILANNFRGNSDDIQTIWEIVTAPQISIRMTVIPPACFLLAVKRETPLSTEMAGRVGNLMRSIKPAGISMQLIEAISGYWGFSDDTGNPGVDLDDGSSLGFDIGVYSRVL